MKIQCWKSPDRYFFEIELESSDDEKYLIDSGCQESLGKRIQRAIMYTIRYYGIEMPDTEKETRLAQDFARWADE